MRNYLSFLCLLKYSPFWNDIRFAVGLWSCNFFLVLMLCTEKFRWHIPDYLPQKSLTIITYILWCYSRYFQYFENTFTSSSWSCSCHNSDSFFYCNWKTLKLFLVTTKYNTMLHYWMEICKTDHLSVSTLLKWYITFTSQQALLSVVIICSMWFFQSRCLSITKPRNFIHL